MEKEKPLSGVIKRIRTDKRAGAGCFIILTLLFTWILQFMPILLGLDIENTSVSSFDFASLFFTIGGLMPTLMGIIFVFVIYSREGIKDFLKRCFVPNRACLPAIGLALALVCFEVLVTQLISKCFGAEPLGFEGLKLIAKNPLYLFYFLFWGIISGPFSEEFGWRGFLTDMLAHRDRLTRGSLFIGFVWGIWHLPLYFYPAQIQNEWMRINPLLGIGFIVSTMTAALVYTAIYVVAERRVFAIFFLHMFKNIILTGAMIYPFSDTYKIVVVPVEITIDIFFYCIFTRMGYYKRKREEAFNVTDN